MSEEKPKAVIVSPIDIERIEGKGSPFGEGGRWRIMIYRCVTDPAADFVPYRGPNAVLRDSEQNKIELILEKDELKKLRDSLDKMLKEAE